MRFIYTIIISYNISSVPDMVDFLNKRGEEGWELVGVIEYPYLDDPSKVNYYKFYFKKEV